MPPPPPPPRWFHPPRPRLLPCHPWPKPPRGRLYIFEFESSERIVHISVFLSDTKKHIWHATHVYIFRPSFSIFMFFENWKKNRIWLRVENVFRCLGVHTLTRCMREKRARERASPQVLVSWMCWLAENAAFSHLLLHSPYSRCYTHWRPLFCAEKNKKKSERKWRKMMKLWQHGRTVLSLSGGRCRWNFPWDLFLGCPTQLKSWSWYWETDSYLEIVVQCKLCDFHWSECLLSIHDSCVLF